MKSVALANSMLDEDAHTTPLARTTVPLLPHAKCRRFGRAGTVSTIACTSAVRLRALRDRADFVRDGMKQTLFRSIAQPPHRLRDAARVEWEAAAATLKPSPASVSISITTRHACGRGKTFHVRPLMIATRPRQFEQKVCCKVKARALRAN